MLSRVPMLGHYHKTIIEPIATSLCYTVKIFVPPYNVFFIKVIWGVLPSREKISNPGTCRRQRDLNRGHRSDV